ncbi:transposase, IS4 family [Leptospira inadai serovar Lyme str. 10]|uniref:Transposase, IS4 family n=1 Tax=Leptospira inadai serovar Lyme str. 10 TaxID=1049790 RepID=V6HDJ0_9LEPT|nr:transposase, IS4 family [Leptospira inadai serovar Lyme str. 10]
MISKSPIHDSKLLSSILNNFRVYRNRKLPRPEIFSLDKTYIGQPIRNDLRRRKIRYRIPNKKNAINPEYLPTLKKYRWVVERTFAWINSIKAAKTCWEFKENNYLATLKIVFTLIRMSMALE